MPQASVISARAFSNVALLIRVSNPASEEDAEASGSSVRVGSPRSRYTTGRLAFNRNIKRRSLNARTCPTSFPLYKSGLSAPTNDR